MEIDKQKLLLSYLISDHELFVKVSPILNTKYFDPQLKSSVSFIKEYFEQYKAPPNAEQIKAETNGKIETRENISRQESLYAENEIEKFCKEKAIEHAIMSSPALLAEGKHAEIETLIKDALTVSLNRNLGLDYFKDPEARLTSLSLNSRPTPTGFIDLDENLGGGLNRKEMIIFAAPPGVGKSLTMANVSRNLMKQGLNVVYISLELAEEVVAKRFDSMFSGVAQIDILKNITKTAIEIKKQEQEFGKLTIKRMPESTTNANHIRAYLKEYEIIHGFVPDALVVDYMDLMTSNHQISAENQFIKDKYISEELRSIANEYNLMMITASQLNRSAQELESMEDLKQSHIAGGISKANTTDNMVAITQTRTMKARNEMCFKMLKTRSSSGVNNIFIMQFDPKSLILSCTTSEDANQERNNSLSSFIRGKVAKQSSTESSSEQSNTNLPKSPKMGINNIPFQV